MSFLTRLFGRPKVRKVPRELATKTKSYAVQANGGSWQGFSKRNRDGAKLNEYKHIAIYGGPVTTALTARPRFVWSKGWYLEGDDQALKDLVHDRLTAMGIRKKMFTGIFDAEWAGNGILEIVPTRADGISTIENRPAEQFDIEWDEYGNITKYIQHVPKYGGETKDIPIDPKYIIDITLMQIGGSPYGISMVESAYDDIMRDCKITEGLAKAIQRHGTPKFQIQIGQPGEVVPDETVDAVSERFRRIDTDNEFVGPADVKINPLDSGGVSNVAEYSTQSMTRLAAALNVPEEMMGLGRGSTEATANVKFEAFLYEIESLQEELAQIINTRIVDAITGQPGAVKFCFHSPSRADLGKAEFVAKLLTSNPIDPYSIWGGAEAYAAWARNYLDIQVPDIPESEESPDSEMPEAQHVPEETGEEIVENPDTEEAKPE